MGSHPTGHGQFCHKWKGNNSGSFYSFTKYVLSTTLWQTLGFEQMDKVPALSDSTGSWEGLIIKNKIMRWKQRVGMETDTETAYLGRVVREGLPEEVTFRLSTVG